MSDSDPKEQQLKICNKFKVPWVNSPPHLKVGIAKNVGDGLMPVNGLRHHPTGDTTGWYIWAGETFSTAPDFFVPVHVEHLKDRCPEALKFLGLPPGWRFLIASGYEDAWHDPSLLSTHEPGT